MWHKQGLKYDTLSLTGWPYLKEEAESQASPTISIGKSNQEYYFCVVADKGKESFDDHLVSQVKTQNKAGIYFTDKP